MDVEKLKKAYEAVEMLKALDLPVNDEQLRAISELENAYLEEKVLPSVIKEAQPLFSQLKGSFRVTLSYSENEGLKVGSIDRPMKKTPEPVRLPAFQSYSHKAKSIGFAVSFSDGTVFHEAKAVNTWILTLKKIGFETIYNNRNNFDAWHVVDGKDICVVEKTPTIRKHNNKCPQRLIDGYYIMVQLSNEQKVGDLMAISAFMPELGMVVTWDSGLRSLTQEETTQLPTFQCTTSKVDSPIKKEFQTYLAINKSEGTARTYTSTLDNPVRLWVNKEVDLNADSVFSYTTVEEVILCMEKLYASPDFVNENDRKHHSMSAALTQYLMFIKQKEQTD